MGAILIERRKELLPGGEIVEIVIWLVPSPVPPSEHDFKYRLVMIRNGKRLIGYDNERGKGDHHHVHGVEKAYRFIDIETLLRDFRADIARETAS